MIRILAGAAILALLVGPAAAAQTLDKEQTRADFESMAGQLKYLAIDAVLPDSQSHYFRLANPENREGHFRIIGRVTDGTHSMEALLELLGHDDPKVRTLAAVALFDREDPSVLPALMELRGDKTLTFVGHAEIARALELDRGGKKVQIWSGMGPPRLKQTVEYIAMKMVGFYMERSGYPVHLPSVLAAGISESLELEPARAIEPEFAKYWEARKDRSHCGSWFAVQLARARGSAGQEWEKGSDRFRALRERIDALPADERTWMLLYLKDHEGGSVLVTDDDLVELCKELGPEKLLLMLQGKIPYDDPDLQWRRGRNGRSIWMSRWVLHHADQVLRPGDSDAILECERWQRDYRKHRIEPFLTPWWAIAAARLKPERASEILHAALGRFQGEYDYDERSELWAAMGHICSSSEIPSIVDRFYEETPGPASFTNARGAFITRISKGPNASVILAGVVRDPRFAEIDWAALETLVLVLNQWVEEPVMTWQKLRRGPSLVGERLRSLEEAETKWPEETAKLRADIEEWRKQVRESVPEGDGDDRKSGEGHGSGEAPPDSEEARR